MSSKHLLMSLLLTVSSASFVLGATNQTQGVFHHELFNHLSDYVRARHQIETTCTSVAMQSGLSRCSLVETIEQCMTDVLEIYPELPKDYFLTTFEITRTYVKDHIAFRLTDDSDSDCPALKANNLTLNTVREGDVCTVHELALAELRVYYCLERQISEKETSLFYANLGAVEFSKSNTSSSERWHMQLEEQECSDLEKFVDTCLVENLSKCFPNHTNEFMREVLFETQYFHYRMSKVIKEENGHKDAASADTVDQASDVWFFCSYNEHFKSNFSTHFSNFLLNKNMTSDDIQLWDDDLAMYFNTSHLEDLPYEGYNDDAEVDIKADTDSLGTVRDVLLIMASLVVLVLVLMHVVRKCSERGVVKVPLVGNGEVPYRKSSLEMDNEEEQSV